MVISSKFKTFSPIHLKIIKCVLNPLLIEYKTTTKTLTFYKTDDVEECKYYQIMRTQ